MAEKWIQITNDELKQILVEHHKWLSDKKTGSRAVLRNKQLNPQDLSNINLSEADLSETNLFNVNLSNANLTNANLSGAKLESTNLKKAVLRDANLQKADLSQAMFLKEEQLSGTDLTGAILPSFIDFKCIDHLNESSKNARSIFMIMLLTCLYSIITIHSTVISSLITNSANTNLPFLNVNIPIVWFYYTAWIYLLGIYVYYHIIMLRLWEIIGGLPALFQDGRSLDQRMHPWLVTGIIYVYFDRLKSKKPLIKLQWLMVVILSWGSIPLTIMLLWWKFLGRREIYWTFVHIISFLTAIIFGIFFYHITVSQLKGSYLDNSAHIKWYKSAANVPNIAMISATLIITIILSFYSIATVNSKTAIDLSFKKISQTPSNWNGNVKDVTGAVLTGRNLEGLKGEGTFLVQADMTKINLKGANLRGADLEDATLIDAEMQNINLKKANLKGATLSGANLTDAVLNRSNLSETSLVKAILINASLFDANLASADLSGAKLNNAELTQTNLDQTDFSYADLTGADINSANVTSAIFFKANLTKADLRLTKGLTIKQLKETKSLYKTKLDPLLLYEIEETAPHLLEEYKSSK
ncbi:MAG: pentapeptide repeat-containing protein [Nitrospirae bacterium]|nr:pentapeptide repeat-containing protein [Nitrospirota bacterium]